MTQERILIIDPHIHSAFMLRTRLEKQGYLADCVRTFDVAMDVLKKKWVDLIIVNVDIEKEITAEEGIITLKKKKAFSQIPIIVQRAKTGVHKKFKELGVVSVFKGATQIHDFLDEIKDIFTRKVLIAGKREEIFDRLVKYVAKNNIKIDWASSVEKFAAKVKENRYGLIVLPFKIKAVYADKLCLTIRKTKKNSHVPLVVYRKAGTAPKRAHDERQLQQCEATCQKIIACHPLVLTSSQQCLTSIKKYLEAYI